MRLKRYAVEIHSNIAPRKTFWTLEGADLYANSHPDTSTVLVWRENKWRCVNSQPQQ